MLLPPVVPYRGVRGIDGFGAGGYGAPRVHDRNGVDRQEGHLGLDLVSTPGDMVVCPFVEATYARFGYAYPWTRDLTLVVLQEVLGQHRVIRLLYVEPDKQMTPGTALRAGDQVGIAQPLAEAYARRIESQAAAGDAWARAKFQANARMTNHVHLGLLDAAGKSIDPTLLLSLPKAA